MPGKITPLALACLCLQAALAVTCFAGAGGFEGRRAHG